MARRRTIVGLMKSQAMARSDSERTRRRKGRRGGVRGTVGEGRLG